MKDRGAWWRGRGLATALLAVYLVGLTWVVLFKMQFGPDVFGTMRSVNLVPLAGAVVVNGAADYGEVVQNVLAFVPFGLFVGMLKPEWPFWAKLAPVALTSLAFEALQFAFAAGASDVTDLLANTLGGALGLGAYALARLSARSDERALGACNVVALVGTVLVLGFVALVMVANR